MKDLLALPAVALREKLRARELSARELTQATLNRIDAVNPLLNAVVARDDAGALAAADAADARLASGTARALEGLPITIKDAYEVKGLVSTGGAPELAGFVPDEDAIAVARLRAAGAIILGKTNVPYLSSDFQSYNAIYGATNNPWDLAHTPGGSSGGAAAAVAAGMSAFELGSDIGGSIRWPASACGVFGLKATWDLIPLFGHVPPTRALRTTTPMELGVAGPLGRSAADLDLVLSIVAGPMNAAGPAFLPKPRATTPAGLRLAVWLDEANAVDTRVRQAVETSADLLAREGAKIDRAARPDFTFREAFETYSLLLNAVTVAGFPRHARDRIADSAKDFADDDMSHRALQARAARMSADMHAALAARRRRIRAALADFFTRYDAILCPATPAPAIAHDHQRDSFKRVIETDVGPMPYFDMLHGAALATLANLPAAVAPAWRAPVANGLMPIGVQIVAAENEDRTAIAIAGMIERANGGFVAPPLAGAA